MKTLFNIACFTILLVPNTCLAADDRTISTIIPLKEHRKILLDIEKEGGSLDCNKENRPISTKYKSCKSFYNLQKNECFGVTTFDMSRESFYKTNCNQIDILKKAKNADKNYFNLNSSDWWKELPASIIPMPGGIYTDKSWNKGKHLLDKMVKEKLLKDITFESIEVRASGIKAVLKSTKNTASDCGKIEDVLTISPVLLADFDEDGIAEIKLEGYRAQNSDTCPLGSGNFLGARFIKIVKKSNPTATPVIFWPQKTGEQK